MSQYIRIINAVRTNIARLPLTKSQADCRIALIERLEYPGVVNLYGPHGCGKTFVGWCMANEGRVAYVVEPAQLAAVEHKTPAIFIDNAEHRRTDYRRILDDLERARINRAVVITLERIEDSVQAFELHCTPDDIHLVCTNMAKLGHPIEAMLPVDLWDVLQCIARRE